MVEVKGAALERLRPLFAGWDETLVYSVLEGCMGRAWADSLESPRAALLQLGDFFFLGGDAACAGARELAGFLPAGFQGEVALVVPQSGPWARDFCSNFSGWEEFAAHGAGVLALWGDEPVAGAASYSWYRRGIEIEIDTREDFRRRGLALCCGAALILRCLERGLYPSWDAATPISVALAEKLGYHFSHEYACVGVKPLPTGP